MRMRCHRSHSMTHERHSRATCWIQGARASNAEDLSLHPGQRWRLTITIEELERFPSILMFTPDSRWHFSDRSQILKTSGNLLLIVQ